MTDAPRDGNFVPTALFQVDGQPRGTVAPGRIDQVTGRVLVDSAASSSDLTVGTTTITSGTNTRILYDNSGVLGEYTISGTGNVAMTTSAALTTPTVATSITPASNDGAALGTTALQWSDLFLAVGGVINWANGGITITESSDALAFAGAANGYTFDSTIVLNNTSPLVIGVQTPILQQLSTGGNSGVHGLGMFSNTLNASANIAFYKSHGASIGSATVVSSGSELGKLTWYGAQQTGTYSNQNPAAQIRVEVDGTVTSGASGDMPGRIVFATTPDGSGLLSDRLILDSTGTLKPNVNDGVALGTTTLSYSDLFLASGGVINWNNGNATLTHSTGLLTSNVPFSVGTSNAITTGTIELGAASDTTLSRSAAGVLAVEGVVIPSISSTNTLTNKRITKRTGTTASSATPTINTDNVDFYSITALATDITSMTTNLSGTPNDADTLWIAITDNGTSRAITWGTSFEASGTVGLPAATTISTRMDIGFVWNTATSKWRCVAVA